MREREGIAKNSAASQDLFCVWQEHLTRDLPLKELLGEQYSIVNYGHNYRQQISWILVTLHIWNIILVALEKEKATHSSTLAWRIPYTEEPGGLQSMGSQRGGHDWSGLACTPWKVTSHSQLPAVPDLFFKMNFLAFISPEPRSTLAFHRVSFALMFYALEECSLSVGKLCKCVKITTYEEIGDHYMTTRSHFLFLPASACCLTISLLLFRWYH